MPINPDSHVPIFRQIAAELAARIAAEVYRPGEPLPSLRALALELVVNPNTVARAYELLEREGLVCSRRGVGIFAAPRAGRSARSRAEARVGEIFAQGVEAAQAAGLGRDTTRSLFEKALKRRGAPTGSRK